MSEQKGKSSTGIEPNLAGLLCYAGWWITGLIFFVLEKESKFVRFHAMQSIVVFGAITAAMIVLSWIPFIGWVFNALLGALSFVLWLILMIMAYQGKMYKLPWAGDFAERQM